MHFLVQQATLSLPLTDKFEKCAVIQLTQTNQVHIRHQNSIANILAQLTQQLSPNLI